MSSTKWAKGQSGNPGGRKPGNTLGAKLREAVGADFEAIVQAVVNAAVNGDMAAASLLLSRTCPPVRPVQEPLQVAMPGTTLTEKAAAILEAVGQGELSPMDAKSLLDGLASVARIIEIDDLERRIRNLEDKQP